MGGGKSQVSQQAGGTVQFNPTSIGGGTIYVGGNIGQGPIMQDGTSMAEGGKFGLDFTFGKLMNLQGLD